VDDNGEVWAITMVRDEEDIVRATVGNMLTQVDRVLVADNLSRDNTRTILNQMAYRYPKQLEVVNDDEPGYYQSRKMTSLALRAYQEGARWVVPFDADEYWVGSLGTIAETLRAHDHDFGIVTAELYDHVATRLDPTSSTSCRGGANIRSRSRRWRVGLVATWSSNKATTAPTTSPASPSPAPRRHG
jgi:glycosyltransferase involved in cell wall biosynthesis